jgi:curli biogenesis system outer membrane secretion channel CsgG
MKKVLFVLVLMMAALVVNAQTKATTTQAKPTVTVVKVADLPKAITDNVAKDYAGFTIKDATCTNKNNVVTYHVVIVKETTSKTLAYDKDGKFIKEVGPKVVTKPAPKK